MRRWYAPATLLVVLAFAAASAAMLPGSAASAAPAAESAAHQTSGKAACTSQHGGVAHSDGWSATEPLRRDFFDAAGATSTSNCFRLQVDKHTNLQDHERITVTWSGAHVTAGRSLNPFGETGLPQEYPVVLMECRGADPKNFAGGTVPQGREAVSPETCPPPPALPPPPPAPPPHRLRPQDAASHHNTDHLQGIDPADVPDSCNVNASSDYDITPFRAADGTRYAGCSSQSMPPEASVSSVSIPNEVYAFTNTDGRGSFPFEVRTALENQSLGCSASVPCTLEVIPIDGINCDNADPSAACNQTGNLPPGQVNLGQAPQDAVAPAFWASASNWDRRVPVPLDFAAPPSVCSVARAGKPVPFYGSELLGQATLQWIPAFCLNRKRFNLEANAMPDDAAYSLMLSGEAAAAEVSSGSEDANVGYAPTAVTGWAIAFDIDKPGNSGQQQTLKLDALLLAKLLTESYPGSTTVAASHPGFSKNPLSLNLDPDFIALNPGLDTSHWSEAAATILSTGTTSQVMTQLTSYIASDPKAMAFLAGKAEHDGPYTMRVNPAYKGVQLPVDTWPQLDTWQFATTPNACLHAQGDSMPPYMPLLANPVTSLQLSAQALLYNWPNVATGCTGTGTTQDPYQLGRIAPQGVGNRFLLGLVTLGDAERYGLTTAKLQASPGHFVAADSAGIKAALALATKADGLYPFHFDQAKVRRSAHAYPGTMVVYTAAKTYGLAHTTAQDVAQFIRVSSTEGQRPGRGNGQLAAGYVPITKSGVTGPFYAQAQAVATAVAAQQAPKTPSGPAGSPSGPTGPGTTPNGGTLPGTAPGGAPPASSPSTGATEPAAGTTPVADAPLVTTAAVSSRTGGGLLVLLLVIGVVAGLGAVLSRTVLRGQGLR